VRFCALLSLRFSACLINQAREFPRCGTPETPCERRLVLPDGSATRVAASDDSFCAILAAGTLQCFGRDLTSPPAGTFSKIAMNDTQACGLRTEGTISCWGAPSTPPMGQFLDVAVGCGVSDQGALVCWDGSTPPAGTFTSVRTAADHACALSTDQTISCWGNTQAPDGQFVQVVVDQAGGCALDPNGNAICWGGADRTPLPPAPYAVIELYGGELCGIGLDSLGRCAGYAIPYPELADLAVGPGYACGVTVDGALECYGPKRPEP
jgi:hypothetical protein